MSDRLLIICLHSGSHPVPWAIRWLTHSHYSHVSLLLPDGRHVETREWQGVVIHPHFSPKSWEHVDFFTLADPLSESELAALTGFVAETEGEPYDYLTVYWFLLGTRRSRPSATRWFCSEWVYTALGRGGRKLLGTDRAWQVTPGDVALSPLLTPIEKPASV